MGWMLHVDVVTGTGNDILTFQSTTPNNYGPALDDVSLNAVPEPTALCLALIGLFGVGVAKYTQDRKDGRCDEKEKPLRHLSGKHDGCRLSFIKSIAPIERELTTMKPIQLNVMCFTILAAGLSVGRPPDGVHAERHSPNRTSLAKAEHAAAPSQPVKPSIDTEFSVATRSSIDERPIGLRAAQSTAVAVTETTDGLADPSSWNFTRKSTSQAHHKRVHFGSKMA